FRRAATERVSRRVHVRGRLSRSPADSSFLFFLLGKSGLAKRGEQFDQVAAIAAEIAEDAAAAARRVQPGFALIGSEAQRDIVRFASKPPLFSGPDRVCFSLIAFKLPWREP